ncbi:hypothetical protein KKC94_05570 [Patescibacteria group bacterium]|nr:hypothetical protein [Patescibacteria group bacterium]
MKKKFENFLKQLGDSPKKKSNISYNVPANGEVPEGHLPQGQGRYSARSAHWPVVCCIAANLIVLRAV